ncbi:MAG: minichromosome maintenance protein MCM [Candidatus Aenigmarchaeota archaeon]|nr:minichromosome maintenance protein MCM [Candidatus Aenigmarchaeota archaeon]
MKKNDIIDQFTEFLREKYYKDLALVVSESEKNLQVDFLVLDKFNPQLADAILENPDENLEHVSKSVEQIDFPKKQPVKIRFFNLPESTNIRIRNVRAEHIGRLLSVDGVVKRASEVRPEISEIVFECQECGQRMIIIQDQKEKAIKYPIRCDCGNRRNFKVVKEKLYDARWIAIEEPFEITTGERPSEIMVYLKEDLVSPKSRNKTEPGNRIKVIGVLKEVPRKTARGKKTRQMEILIDANNFEVSEAEWEEIEISPEDEKKIKRLATDKQIYDKLIQSLAPTMYGLDIVKLSIVLQMFGGVPHALKDGTRIRGDIHLLLIGDPATGKSQLLKLASDMIPRGKYVSGKGVTGAGLTAAVVKDEQFMGGWVLEAGALVLANNSMISIDEFEKMDKDDQVAMHEALSLQTVSIAKAAIVATLPAKTSVLAGANPKFGRFDPYIPIREQIIIPETLLSRFDLKFALRDIPDVQQDEKMVDHVLGSRHFKQEESVPVIDPKFLKKYIAYAKMNCKPNLTKAAGNKLKEFYVGLRGKSTTEESPVPITLRQYEGLIRLSEASAKVRLRDKVQEDDAQRAIDIMKFSLRQFGFDPETGLIDIDRAEGAMATSAQRSKIRIVLDVIEELHIAIGKNIPVDEIIRRAREEGVERPEDIIKRMKTEGIIFEPRPRIIQKV